MLQNTTDVAGQRDKAAATNGSLQSIRSPTESLQISNFNSSVPATSYSSSEDSDNEDSDDDFFDACEDAVSTEEGTETPLSDSPLVDHAPMFKKNRKNSRDGRAAPGNIVQSPSESSTICELSDRDMTPFVPPPEAPPDMEPHEFDELYEDQSDSPDQNANFRYECAQSFTLKSLAGSPS